jgi:hypothetical protein
VAAVLTLLLHAGYGWLAMKATGFPESVPEDPSTPPPAPAMELVLVRRASPGVAAPQVSAAPVAEHPVRADAPGLSARFVARPDAPPPAPTEPAPRVTTLDDAWTRAGGEPDAARFRTDPFERRPATLPGGGARRFRMRPPRSPASVLANAATLLGLRPEGYEASPCPRIARNVSALATSLDPADRAALAHELEMQDSFCR